MPEDIVQGYSIEEIRQEWGPKLGVLPEDLTLEVIEKSEYYPHKLKVRLTWDANLQQPPPQQANRDEIRYVLKLGEAVKRIRPFTQAGDVWLNGKIQEGPFSIALGDQVEFQPSVQLGHLTWELQILHFGLSVVAKVRHEQAGRYILANDLPDLKEIDLSQFVTWEALPPEGQYWDEEKLRYDLEQLKVVDGIRPGIWQEIMSVKGSGEVVIAEAIFPVPPEHAQLEDFVGVPQEFSETEKIDYFASKVKLIEESAVLARKIPGKPGIPGKDVQGKVLPAASVKDFQFRLKKNVCLSDDGLEVLATCAGQPVRLDEWTYTVENIYVLNQDLDLTTGSIEFPGDVYINGNVQDGLRVISGGKIEIRGSVSQAEIRAEKGVKIHQSLVGGKSIVGEKFVVRSELLRLVSELRGQLNACLFNTAELLKSPGAKNLRPGQCLKIIIEKRFSDLPKLSNSVETYILAHKDDSLITEDIIALIRTAKQFLVGLGPSDPKSLPFLLRVDQALEQFINNITVEIPEKLTFVVNYIQGAVIECGGSVECKKGTYNADIRVEGDVTIEGVCRGGKISAGGKVTIRELGGSGVSSTFVQISPNGRLLVDYCHPNVIIAVGKEIIKIEEAYRKLEIYREKGRTEVERIKANPF